MNKKTVITFVGGMAAGAYMMYNKLYREVSKIALNNKVDKKPEEENKENEEA